MIYKLSDALYALYPNSLYSISNEDYSTLIWRNDTPKPSLKELETKRDQMQAEYDSKDYQRKRLKEYNAIGLGEQFDMIYHDMDGWKTRIKSIKDKYPKP